MRSRVPRDRLYHRDHLWVRVEGNEAVVGAAERLVLELGEVEAVELTEAGTELAIQAPFGSLAAGPSRHELAAPISGEVVEVNRDLASSPETLAEDPYGEGWMLRLLLEEPRQASTLLSPDEYEEYLEGLEEP